MELSDRVRKKRIELGLSQEELAEKMGYSSRSSINKIEMGRPISQKIIIRLAKALDTTPAYLMGWEEEPESVTTNIIKSLRNKKKVTLDEMADDMHIDVSLLKKYEDGTIDIPQELAKKIATYFDVSVDEIIGIHTSSKSDRILITKNERVSKGFQKWIDTFKGETFTDEEIEELITFGKFLLSKRKKE